MTGDSGDQALIRRRQPAGSLSPLGELEPMLQRLYTSRGVAGVEELDYSLERLPAPEELPGLVAAAECLAEQLMAGRCIVVVGDFDADGATACALCVRGLQAMGGAPAAIGYIVPDRQRHGYGLSPQLMPDIVAMKPDLLITADNGIVAVDGVAEANTHGIEVIITDHHLPGEVLPDARAIVNPKLKPEPFGGSNLAGVGVMFYLLLGLRAELRRRDYFVSRGLQEPNMRRFLDLVAIGTAADMVPLDHCNRILISHGLENIRAGTAVPGIRALLRVARRQPATLKSADLSFVLAPRLNAAGRLEDMTIGIECLLTEDSMVAHDLAAELERINRQRRVLQRKMQTEAERLLSDCRHADGGLAAGLCLYKPGWHQGVVGLVANHISRRCHRPVIACADAGDGLLKGSARSVPGFNLFTALGSIASRHSGLLAQFGGHAGAAGLSVAKADLARLAGAFAAEAASRLGGKPTGPVFDTDGSLNCAELSLDNALLLERSGPWGQGFAEPLFDGEFGLKTRQSGKQKPLHLSLETETGKLLPAIWFEAASERLPADGQRVRVIYRLGVHRWQQEQQLRLLIEHLEPC